MFFCNSYSEIFYAYSVLLASCCVPLCAFENTLQAFYLLALLLRFPFLFTVQKIVYSNQAQNIDKIWSCELS